jgi:hypothetical protein
MHASQARHRPGILRSADRRARVAQGQLWSHVSGFTGPRPPGPGSGPAAAGFSSLCVKSGQFQARTAMRRTAARPRRPRTAMAPHSPAAHSGAHRTAAPIAQARRAAGEHSQARAQPGRAQRPQRPGAHSGRHSQPGEESPARQPGAAQRPGRHSPAEPGRPHSGQAARPGTARRARPRRGRARPGGPGTASPAARERPLADPRPAKARPPATVSRAPRRSAIIERRPSAFVRALDAPDRRLARSTVVRRGHGPDRPRHPARGAQHGSVIGVVAVRRVPTSRWFLRRRSCGRGGRR